MRALAAAAIALVGLACGGTPTATPSPAPPASSVGETQPEPAPAATAEPVTEEQAGAAEVAPETTALPAETDDVLAPVEEPGPVEPEQLAAVQMEDHSGGGNEIDDLLDQALSGRDRPPSSQNGGGGRNPGGLPATPSRSEIVAAFGAQSAWVGRCYDGPPATVLASVAFVSSGRAADVRIEGDVAGTAAASCIVRVLRRMTLPRFADPRFRVTYPFRVGR